MIDGVHQRYIVFLYSGFLGEPRVRKIADNPGGFRDGLVQPGSEFDRLNIAPSREFSVALARVGLPADS